MPSFYIFLVHHKEILKSFEALRLAFGVLSSCLVDHVPYYIVGTIYNSFFAVEERSARIHLAPRMNVGSINLSFKL